MLSVEPNGPWLWRSCFRGAFSGVTGQTARSTDKSLTELLGEPERWSSVSASCTGRSRSCTSGPDRAVHEVAHLRGRRDEVDVCMDVFEERCEIEFLLVVPRSAARFCSRQSPALTRDPASHGRARSAGESRLARKWRGIPSLRGKLGVRIRHESGHLSCRTWMNSTLSSMRLSAPMMPLTRLRDNHRCA